MRVRMGVSGLRCDVYSMKEYPLQESDPAVEVVVDMSGYVCQAHGQVVVVVQHDGARVNHQQGAIADSHNTSHQEVVYRKESRCRKQNVVVA